MEPRLTRGEYWLLEEVVEHRVPLCFLAGDDIEAMFNKPGHGMDRALLVESIARLRDDGHVDFARFDCMDERVRLSTEEIAAALSERGPVRNPTCAYYGLTSSGGLAWERFAAPNWDRFVCESWDHRAKSGRLRCTSEKRIRQHLADMHAGAYELTDECPELTPIGQWNATYWKTLPSGYETSFSWSKERFDFNSDRKTWLAFVGFCDGRRAWYRWH